METMVILTPLHETTKPTVLSHMIRAFRHELLQLKYSAPKQSWQRLVKRAMDDKGNNHVFRYTATSSSLQDSLTIPTGLAIFVQA
jgi:hypothetical protein